MSRPLRTNQTLAAADAAHGAISSPAVRPSPLGTPSVRGTTIGTTTCALLRDVGLEKAGRAFTLWPNAQTAEAPLVPEATPSEVPATGEGD